MQDLHSALIYYENYVGMRESLTAFYVWLFFPIMSITMNPEVAESWVFFWFWVYFFLKIQDDNEKNVDGLSSPMH